ncbi:unnamed protein product [Acanthoscelides obtectus]|uniref:Magnesium-dependent phosphatase 1 n=1 Tax=Acanthoscelides obtectus TaxID=200917 RepID=A0A9P0KFG3_ACAOB|nr:unnamed protein product [Acanthoscelides obtectus]CAK1635050.1 Magnesium-dependent phosphatase 1 [Acanthoscelides obtectus]
MASSQKSSKTLKLIVFDLDFTLWPYWADCHIQSPYRIASNEKIIDSAGNIVECYPDVPEVLADLHKKGYILGVASRCPDREGCRQLLNLFGFNKYLKYIEIHDCHKFQHFEKIKKSSGVDFSEMMFFDDDKNNIRDISSMGVVSILVREGITKQVVDDGIRQFHKRCSVQ